MAPESAQGRPRSHLHATPLRGSRALLLALAAYLLAPCAFVASPQPRRVGQRRRAAPDDEGFWSEEEPGQEEVTAPVASKQRRGAQASIQ